MNSILNNIADRLLKCRFTNKEVHIFPHIRVDGDALGSAAALALALENLAIKCKIYMDYPVPTRLKFLNVPERIYAVYEDSEIFLENALAQQCVAIAVDCSQSIRMGNSGNLFGKAAEVMVIDHHISSGESADLKIVDITAAATAQLIYHLIVILEQKSKSKLLDSLIANCLMSGLQSDTGRFSYQNTTAESFRVAAALVEAGADVYLNSYNLFDATDMSRVKLLSEATMNAEFFCDKKLVISVVTLGMLAKYQAEDESVDSLVSSLRDIRGVEVSFVIRETAHNEIRVNIRSQSIFDAAAFAVLFGGGGHKRAAGFSVTDIKASDIMKIIIEKASVFLQEK